ncbi:MAG TPA: XdhC family protein [Sphaerochaeta sp.]|nr:XdhC family protein [Sphaerochaeta sp.]
MDYQDYYKTLSRLIKRADVERRTVLSGAAIGSEALFVDGELVASLGAETVDWTSSSLLVEHLSGTLEVVLFGGGHVGREVAFLCSRLGLSHTVIDDRPEFCNRERFPDATLLPIPYEEVFSSDRGWVRPIFIIATRGHSHDHLCLAGSLAHPARYIGMIGSRAKVAKTFSLLKEEGFSDEALQAVHAPIGLKIGAVTASEIALSIMAEVVAVYRGEGNPVRLDQRVLALQRERAHIAVRVVVKHGSAPAEVGFTLALFEDGTAEGTIGGGIVEAYAIEEARAMARDPSIGDHITPFDLSHTEAASIGMICGGSIEVLFQRRA